MTMKKDTAPPVRQRMSATQRREQLLDATRRLVDTEGFRAATIGGGGGGGGGTVNIFGGTVKATGNDGAGIGGGIIDLLCLETNALGL